ncbi:hypothetical protein ACNSOL_11755 (plasmid) [Aliarcobacter lanthieri]|uniref:hypothetical protein n=1 Tax=Aliarcobacter lanthieri TaxID=1355374 RepID=UPI003AACD632
MILKEVKNYNPNVKNIIKEIFEEVFQKEIQDFDWDIETGFKIRGKDWKTQIDNQFILLEKINTAMQKEIDRVFKIRCDSSVRINLDEQPELDDASIKVDFIQIMYRLLNNGKDGNVEIVIPIYADSKILFGGEHHTITKKVDEYIIGLDSWMNFEIRATNKFDTDTATFSLIDNGEYSYIKKDDGLWKKFKTGIDPVKSKNYDSFETVDNHTL